MTLRANELRIGNFVTIDNKDSWPEMRDVPVIVTAVKGHMDEDEMRMFPNSRGEVHVLDGKDLYSQFDEFIKPIPIAEEWLLKFGFYRNNNAWEDPKKFNTDFSVWNPVGSKVFEMNSAPIMTTIEFVHQLQNIYFAVTGIELPLANHPV